jgi:hypothetical protein
MASIATIGRLGVLPVLLGVACGSSGGHPGGTTGGAGGSGAPGGAAGTSVGGAAVGGAAGASAGGAAGTSVGGAAGASVGGAAGTSAGGASGGGAAGGSPPGPPAFAVQVSLASDILGTAPTTVGIVTWSLNRSTLTEAHIAFGLDATYGMTAPVDLAAPSYRTVLVGMKAARTYHFQIFATDGAESYASGDQTLATGPLPATLGLPTLTVSPSGTFDRGFIIGSYWMGSHVAFIIDTDGDLVWWFTDPQATASGDGIGRARLSADSHDIWLTNAQVRAPLVRVSIDTLDVQSYPDTKGTHDIAAVSGDTIAYLGWTQANYAADGGGSGCDRIIEMDKAGNTKQVFDSTFLLASDCHGSALRYAKNANLYLFSDRENDVFVVDRAGAIQWKLSDKVAGGHTSWGGIQHGVQLLDTSLLVFANEAMGQGHSQAIEYGLDGSVLRKFTSGGGTDFLGDVQRLPSGGTLINYSSTVQEVDANDDVVLQISAGLLGYTEFRQSLYGPALDVQD